MSKVKLGKRLIPVIELILSAVNYNNAVLYRAKVGVLYDNPDFSIFAILIQFSFAYSIAMFLIGLISSILLRFETKIISLINIIIHTCGLMVMLIATGYSIYILIDTQSVISQYWKSNKLLPNSTRGYIESTVCFLSFFS